MNNPICIANKCYKQIQSNSSQTLMEVQPPIRTSMRPKTICFSLVRPNATIQMMLRQRPATHWYNVCMVSMKI
jgi:hypothetical protein